MNKDIKVLWKNLSVSGKIESVRCKVIDISIISQGKTNDGSFEVFGDNAGIIISLDQINGGIGANEATVTVRSEINPFTFKISDVNILYPIYIAQYNVIVTAGDDKRSYDEITKIITDKKKLTAIQDIENSPEENFTKAFEGTLDASCPTWLSISRDIRIFEVGFRGMRTRDTEFADVSDFIKLKLGFWKADKYKNVPNEYKYLIGRGFGSSFNLERSLEDGYLPILNTKFDDGGIHYSTKMFATLESSALTKENIKGVHYLVSDMFFKGVVLTQELEREKDLIWDSEMNFSEEIVLYFKAIAENNNDIPKYTWVSIPKPNGEHFSGYDNKTGYGTVKDDMVYMIASVNNKPVEQVDIAILIPPGEKVEFLFKIPYSPISKERAKALAAYDFDMKLKECKGFWMEKLSKAMQISLPEKRIENMMKTGFYDLDLICVGNEPFGPIASNVGTYGPIGSESAPIVMYFESIGRTDLAQRALDYFFDKQHDDGFIHNFWTYELETGVVLWITYLHMLYTNNIAWIKEKEEKIIKSCDYIIKWAEKNLKEEFRGRGYGMLHGQVADPAEKYHSYMLNAYAYAGLYGSAKILHKINSAEYERINKAAEELKKNILASLDKNIANSPVVPLGNGLWCPSVSPYPEFRGPICLYTDGDKSYDNCSVNLIDSILGATYLIYLNVIDKNSRYADFIMNTSSELFYHRHTAFAQPFYSQHGTINLLRGERKSFIKEFYNSVAGVADDETYTFWEDTHLCTQHKTHEEAWFMVKCRNMLYIEDICENGRDLLTVMPGVPSEWFLSKENISVKGANTYFGELSYELKHIEPLHRISVDVKLNLRSEKYPKVKVRIPLPDNMKIASVNAGYFIEGTNDIILDDFKGSLEVDIIIRKK